MQVKRIPEGCKGAWALAIEIMCRLGKYGDAVELLERFFGDLMPDVQYGRALAYFKIGRKQKAVVALKDAIASRPLVAKELLNVRHRMPKSISPYGLTMGGADEAYEYWERWGTIWSEDAKAMAWLRRTWERFL
jgi:tetratricopeptide (TPR) repeat protein